MTRSSLVIIGKILLLELIIILPFYLISHFYNKSLEESKHQRIEAYLASQRATLQAGDISSKNIPVRLKIPHISVDASIDSVGLTPSGAMDAPSIPAHVGWFNLGPRPGEIGSAVIDGHFDSETMTNGVFLNLSELRSGDQIYVENNLGVTSSFVVRESHLYDPGYVEKIFTQSDSAHLNLITCDGVWDETSKHFNKRLVVFADLVN